mmetsp:Transcript_30810/g.43131  ORF Transcript_30810/g.43131 Transcript_30810/m.43131 type:complete len:524 (-) Transcript_30810:89-1660(-)
MDNEGYGSRPMSSYQVSSATATTQRREARREHVLKGCKTQHGFKLPPVETSSNSRSPGGGAGHFEWNAQDVRRARFSPPASCKAGFSKSMKFDRSWAVSSRRISSPKRVEVEDMRKINVNNIAVLQWLKKHRKRLPESISKEQRANYRRIFDMMDTDQSRTLDVREISDAQRIVGISMDYREVIELMQSMDPTIGDKESLNFDEFCHTVSNRDEWDALLPLIKRSRERRLRLQEATLARMRHGSLLSRNSKVSQNMSLFQPRRSSLMADSPNKENKGGRNDKESGALSNKAKAAAERRSSTTRRPSTTSSVGPRGSTGFENYMKGDKKATFMPFHLWVPSYHRRHMIKGIVENGCSYLDNSKVKMKMQQVLGLKREKWDQPSKRKFQGFELKDSPKYEHDLRRTSSLGKIGFARPRYTMQQQQSPPAACPPSLKLRSREGRVKATSEKKTEKSIPANCMRLRILPLSVHVDSKNEENVNAPGDLLQANHKNARQRRNKFEKVMKRRGLSSEWRAQISKLDLDK